MWLLFLAFLPFAFSMTASPGPSNVLILASSTNFGYRRTLPVMLGLISGLTFMILAMGLGLSRIFEAYPIVHTILKIVSIAYLLYLAWNIANAGQLQTTTNSQKAMSFFEGLLFQCVNPKAWVVAVSVAATYVSIEHDLTTQIVFICFVFFVIAFISLSIWGIFGTVIARFLQSPKSMRVFNFTLALLLVISLIPLLR